MIWIVMALYLLGVCLAWMSAELMDGETWLLASAIIAWPLTVLVVLVLAGLRYINGRPYA